MSENKEEIIETDQKTVSNEQVNVVNNPVQVEQKKNEKQKLNVMSQLGICFFNLALTAIILAACSVLSPFITLFYYLVLLCVIVVIVILTLGLIFVSAPKLIPNLWKLLVNGGEFLGKVSQYLIDALPYILGVCCALSLIAMVLFLINRKKQKHSARFTFSIIFAIISAVSFVLIVV